MSGFPRLAKRFSLGISGHLRMAAYAYRTLQRAALMRSSFNFSLQRTAGLRFSQFVAPRPAAAEFRCWAYGVMRAIARQRGEMIAYA
jgi:hypothetical protein